MNLKKWFKTACLTAGLVLAAPSLASHISTTVPDTVAYAAQDGWQSDAGGVYYVANGVRLTGMQKIRQASYYFDSDGYRCSGMISVGSKIYYFSNTSGALKTGISGMMRLNESTNDYYYFSSAKDGSVVKNKFVKFNGKTYYAGDNGKIVFGTFKAYNKKMYHSTTSGILKTYARSTYNNKYYYAGSNGVLKTGLQKINGNLYYFSPTTGIRVTGSKKIGGKYYYFNSSNGKAKTGWVKIKTGYYYFGSNGQRQTGLITLNGKKYYLQPKYAGKRATNKWCKISPHYYYFGSDGSLQYGFITYKGKKYYSDSRGVRRKGWMKIDGRYYYFDQTTAAMKTGWFDYKNKTTGVTYTYYLRPLNAANAGSAVSGWLNLNGDYYYFNYENHLLKGRWIYNEGNSSYYYLDKTTGKVLKGNQYIDGKWYNLGKTGAYKQPLSGDWCIRVNRKYNCITVYRGGVPVKAIVCSTARPGCTTPTGTFQILDKLRWHELNGPTWGQYCSHITSDILFHSVPCTRYQDNHSLNAAEFNKLGLGASAGCIRLTVADAKWLYEHCPIGTKVVISDTEAMPLGKPTAPKIPLTQNYDPTDPNA